jgi:diadenosine tetraphosphate (Ap4A) HIT family hydrolase
MPSHTFKKLQKFISKEMRMSHIYQPVMLIELLSKKGQSSVNKIAKSILMHDESQIEYYEQVTKNMVGRVLTKNRGITNKEKDIYSLIGYDKLNKEEIKELITLCNQKIDEYLDKRKDTWSHRKKSAGYITGTDKYEVLKRAKFHCELCGISADKKALEVDHILPRNKGGQDKLSNYQALCYSCNSMKRDRDDTDFRDIADSYKDREKGCLFCEIEKERVIASNELCYAIRDGYAVTEHHSLIIPHRHVSDYFGLYQPELNAVNQMIKKIKKEIIELDSSVSGFNIGMNCGIDAGQTIFHCHLHLIPRRKGDVENPKGGVRGVIADRQKY